ncbi:WD repeat-containing protein 18-like [Mercenaria mercenaria]|uniref:WD repeat-containing protein 18-like n=1 Tax=Mercenaria mercenaria TaxID=6596 RepID=UPI00234EEAC1|nr:WD repeat-containing protein 18-like [Mercenaria mercenaria]
MSAPIEVLFTSDISGQLWNTCVWDINTGTSLTSYKGESTSHRGLCILGNQYLLGSSCSKPLIHVWALQRREQHQLKIICPGRVTALAVSPDGTYCIAAVGEKIHLWQVCTGNLMSVLSRHYQTVNVLKFTDNCSHFISGGEDNLVIVWSLVSVLSSMNNPTRKPEPVRIWSSHSLPVTDVHVGKGGSRCRVVSASLDQTCKIWDMVSGELLQTIVFPTSVMSVAMDTAELRLLAGGSNGDVYCINMYGQPIRTERHIESHDQQGVSCLKGHSKQVTCLSVSTDGTKIVSGSHDHTVKIWDVFSGQCVRTLQHKGQVTNTLIVPTPPAIINAEIKPTLHLQPFKRHLYTGEDNSEDGGILHIRITGQQKEEDREMDLSKLQKEHFSDTNISSLKEELQQVKAINQDIFNFTVCTDGIGTLK